MDERLPLALPAQAEAMSQRHEIARRTLDLVRCSCATCGDEYHERRSLPRGETLETYVHEDGTCSKKCEGILRFWMTCPIDLSLRGFYVAWVLSFLYWNRHGFPQA